MRTLIRLLSVLVVLLTAMGTLSVFAAPPPMFSYQGRLTDPGGSPVPDGPYAVTFTIWNQPVGGINLWSSGAVVVTTSSGLFSIRLGQSPQPALPVAIFYDSLAYLGVKVGVDPEIAPRTQLVATPYSLTTGTLEAAQGGRVFGDLYLNNGLTDYVQTNQAANAFRTFNAGANPATRLWGPSYGEFDMFDNSGTYRGGLAAGFSDFPQLSLVGNANSISLIGGASGDLSVQFPPDAISSTEEMNEPGIAQNAGSIGLAAAAGTYEDITSVTITTPATGYIVITGDGEAGLSAAVGTSARITLGIATASATPPTNGSYFVGCNTTANGAQEFYQYSTSMVDLKIAGTYTYWMVATRSNAAAAAFMYRCHLRAMYVPTSYGAVITPVPPAQATNFAEAKMTTDSKTGANEALVDLRELEVKAARAKAAADAAELALVKARQKQNIDPSKDAGTTPGDNR